MGANSKIEWTEDTWNPIRARNKETGGIGHYCVKVSPACKHCYAERFQPRRNNPIRYAAQDIDLVEIFLDDEALEQPLRRMKPRRIFPCSMTDLFGDFVPDEFIDMVFAVMALTPHHTYQVLTKRADRMLAYLTAPDRAHAIGCGEMLLAARVKSMKLYDGDYHGPTHRRLPLRNVWLGVSAEDQENADARIPLLLQTPAAVRWISAEPLLGTIELDRWVKICKHWRSADDIRRPPWCPPYPKHWWEHQALVGAGYKHPIHWVVAGGESGPGARPMHPDWAMNLRDQCAAAGMPFFFKQWGNWAPQGYADADTGLPVLKLTFTDRETVFGGPSEGTTPYNMRRLGKKLAGRQLDGRTHDEYPP